jgi:hypothetical protein
MSVRRVLESTIAVPTARERPVGSTIVIPTARERPMGSTIVIPTRCQRDPERARTTRMTMGRGECGMVMPW